MAQAPGYADYLLRERQPQGALRTEMARDRLGRDDLPLTHEVIAKMLGTRRATVTEKLAELEGIGAIAAERQHIRMLDRPRLEALTCGCYHVINAANQSKKETCVFAG